MDFMFFKDKEIISFVSDVPGLSSIEECRPKPSIKYLPNWFSQMPRVDIENNTSTIKQCPGLIDYFSKGFVVPMWSDTTLNYSAETNSWVVNSGAASGMFGESMKWDVHSQPQFLQHANHFFLDKQATFIFKAISPWRVITKPGWSVYQLPLFYHFDQNFSVMPGVIDTDVHHEINQQVIYFGNNENVTIKRGTPLALYIPFERKKVSFSIRDQNKKDKARFAKNDINFLTKFPSGGAYRHMQKNRDHGARKNKK